MAYKFNPLTGNLDDYGPVLTGTGTVSAAADGTAALPGIAFTNDLNTGIYRPGADQLALSTGGNGRLFIDASGNVGINTTSATAYSMNLAVVGTVGLIPSTFGAVGTSVSVRSQLGAAGGEEVVRNEITSFANASNYGTATIFTTRNGASVGERLRITSTGQLSHIGAGSSGSPAVSFSGSAASNSLVVDSNSRVGVGTSSPSRPLHVIGSAVFDDGTTQATIWPNLGSNDAGFGTNTNHPVSIVTNGSRRLNITAAGLVGIGTTSASGILHTKAATNQFIGEDSATGNIFAIQNTGGATTLNSYLSTTGRAPIVFTQYTSECGRWDASGRLLVGTASTSSVNRLIVQSSSDAPTGAGTLLIARGDNAPLTTNVLGALRFGGSTHVNSAEISAFRDGGTWTAGSSLPTGLTFSTTSDGQASPTPRLTITSTGQVRLAGAGITFNGDTATANELDDYEEGTWTPTVAGGTTAGTATYSTQVGNYTKVGRQVTLCGSIVYSGGTGTGTLNITNLPFTSANITNNFPIGNCILDSIATAASSQVAITNFPNNTYAAIQSFPIGGGTIVNTSYDAAGSIYFQLTYFTS